MEPKILTAAQRAAYLASGGRVCPFCDAEYSQEGGLVEIDENQAHQDVTCTECDESWTNVYTLSDIIPGEHGGWMQEKEDNPNG